MAISPIANQHPSLHSASHLMGDSLVELRGVVHDLERYLGAQSVAWPDDLRFSYAKLAPAWEASLDKMAQIVADLHRQSTPVPLDDCSHPDTGASPTDQVV